VGDPAATFVAGVGERRGAADKPLARDAVDLLGDRPHEVAPAAGRDVVREPVRGEMLEEFDHRRVRALEVAAREGRMLCAAQECLGARLELDDVHARVRLENPGQHRLRLRSGG
jgi:hypothetical protein